MKKDISDRKPVIDSAHAQGGPKPPHDREQLRKRLLQMILRNESERRSAQIPSGRTLRSNRSTEFAVDLVVFDPEDLIGRELTSGPAPKKRA
jgi:hypothetical protein